MFVTMYVVVIQERIKKLIARLCLSYVCAHFIVCFTSFLLKVIICADADLALEPFHVQRTVKI